MSSAGYGLGLVPSKRFFHLERGMRKAAAELAFDASTDDPDVGFISMLAFWLGGAGDVVPGGDDGPIAYFPFSTSRQVGQLCFFPRRR